MPQLLQQTVECTTSAALPALESVASYTNNPTAIASAIAEIGSYIKASALPTAAAILALAGEIPSTVEDYVDTTAIEPVLVEQFSLQVWERDTLEITALREILKPAINYIKPTIDFVTAHPFALKPLLLPVLIVWLQLMGFRSGGIGTGTLAAMVQSRMGNVPKGSLFAFLQSNGARRFAGLALRSGGGWLLVATLLADVGAVLLEKGAENVTVSALLESVWTDQTSNTTANAATGGAVGGFVGMGWQWWGWWGLLMAAWAWLLTRV